MQGFQLIHVNKSDHSKLYGNESGYYISHIVLFPKARFKSYKYNRWIEMGWSECVANGRFCTKYRFHSVKS